MDNHNFSDYEFLELFNTFPRITSIILYNSKIDSEIKISSSSSLFRNTKNIIGQKSCGIINSNLFVLNTKSFSESQKYNSCLNRKISIDSEGNIKNCPSMKEFYGNIKDTTLSEAIEKPGFKKYWDINKDKIYVCKDCEFRYICTDCRAYVEDPDDILSKPLKCGYNPYTGEWSEWSTNPLKQKAIDFYDMRKMVEEMDVSDSDAT